MLVKALQKVIANTLLDHQLQQQLGREGFTISQLDASFDRQAIYSSSNGAFSVDVSEVFEVRNKTHCASMSVVAALAKDRIAYLATGQTQKRRIALYASKPLVQSFVCLICWISGCI